MSRLLKPPAHIDVDPRASDSYHVLRVFRKVCGVCNAVTDYHTGTGYRVNGTSFRCCVCSRCWSSVSLDLNDQVRASLHQSRVNP